MNAGHGTDLSVTAAPGLVDRMFQVVFYLAYRLHLVWSFLFRPECHGVWVAVWCRGEILLIKNTYRNTITLPGGGIDRGEVAEQAAMRELREEVGIESAPGDLRLWGQYLSRVEYKRDHINLFELELLQWSEIRLDNREVSWADICSPEQALSLALFPALRTYLEDKMAGLRGGGTVRFDKTQPE
jgi:8-oxo-dGTP pyrophosphatase MutT (NUDIX family)